MLIGYQLLGFEEIAVEIESPFGQKENHLDLDGIMEVCAPPCPPPPPGGPSYARRIVIIYMGAGPGQVPSHGKAEGRPEAASPSECSEKLFGLIPP